MRKSQEVAKDLQRRRLRAGRLLLKGVAQAEVARHVGVTRTTVSTWNRELQQSGLGRLEGRGSWPTIEAERAAASRVAQGSAARCAIGRLSYRPVDAAACRSADRAALEASVQPEPGLADSDWPGLLLAAPELARPGAQRACHQALEARALAGVKKNAAKQGRLIVFIDESGLSERPTRVKTWAPKGHTPVLQYHFNWHQLSVIAGISPRGFYFRCSRAPSKARRSSSSCTPLGRQIRQPLLVIWDGAPIHRCALVRDYLEALKGAVQVEPLPPYAPELNPAEYIWGHLKHHELPNRCAVNMTDLKTSTRNRLRSMQRRPSLVRAFWQQAELAL